MAWCFREAGLQEPVRVTHFGSVECSVPLVTHDTPKLMRIDRLKTDRHIFVFAHKSDDGNTRESIPSVFMGSYFFKI